MSLKILFCEEQKFTQWWLWFLLLLPVGIFLYSLLKPFNNGLDIGDTIMISNEMWLLLSVALLIILFLFSIKMVTTIDSEKIHLSHMLFLKKTFYWEEITSAELITYGFEGYGIRLSLNYGTVYNVKGNQGLLLKLKNGKKRLIGTQKPVALEKVVSELKK